jgi:RNA-directed DNA polymerase
MAQWTNKDVKQVAERINPIINGWLNYYGRYGKKELARVLERINFHLMKWVQKKYKRFRRSPKKSYKYLLQMYKTSPNIFAHWKVGISP